MSSLQSSREGLEIQLDRSAAALVPELQGLAVGVLRGEQG
jgi:hypothetical protein